MKNTEDLTIRDYGNEGLNTDSETLLIERSLPQYSQQLEELVGGGSYVLNITGCNRNSHTKIACSLSSNVTTVYDLNESLQKVKTFKVPDNNISCIRFSPQKDNQLFTSSLNGSLRLWDLRTGSHQVQEFLDSTKTDGVGKPISCFDISCDGRFVCAGTEVSGGDAFLLFWDVRSSKLLGGYWESHTEDVTQVVFHPTEPSHLMTGATDGLINLFDISQCCEDDALLTSLNTESTVERLAWIENGNGDEKLISCLTHSCELQLWKETDCTPYCHFSRHNIATAINIKLTDNLYTVNVHQHKDTDNIMLLAGSNMGKGDCLRSVVVKNHLKSVSQFMGNKQIVRTSWYNNKDNILITGGEKGLINVWKPQDENEKTNHTNNISIASKDSKVKVYRARPY